MQLVLLVSTQAFISYQQWTWSYFYVLLDSMICCGMLPGSQLQCIQGESWCTGLLAPLLLHSKEREETLQTLQTLLLLCAPEVADHTHLTLLLPTLDSQLETKL